MLRRPVLGLAPRACAVALALALPLPLPSSSAPGVLAPPAPTSAHAAPGARACQVRYRQRYDKAGGAVVLRLASRCRFPVTCELEWELRCDGEAHPESTSFELDGGASHEVAVSTQRCEGDWQIAGVVWSCEGER